MKNLAVLFVFLLFAPRANSQVVNFGFHRGIGFYKLEEIKEFQTQMVYQAGIPGIESVETFPGSIYYGFSAGSNVHGRGNMGIAFSYFTTGGRNHLADYSGEYKADMILNGYQAGPEYEYYFLSPGRFSMGVQLAGGVMFSHLKLDSRLILFDEEISRDKLILKTTGWFAEPALKFTYQLIEGLDASLNGGYSINEYGKLKNVERGLDLTAEWSGIRASFEIQYRFNLRKPQIERSN